MLSNLKFIRQYRNLSLQKLANKASISKAYLWQLENQPTRKPTVFILKKLANALDTTLDYLIDENFSFETARQLAVYKKFKNLSADNQTKIIQIMDLFANN